MNPTPEGSTQEAYELLQHSEYEKAYVLFTALAQAGDAWAEFYLGWMCDQGLGRVSDTAKAEQHYRHADERGVPDAAYYLARLYRKLKRYPESFEYFEKAAKAGNPSGAYWAYRMLRHGEIRGDTSRASHFLRAASDLGHVFARRDLAKAMIRGEFGFSSIPRGIFALIGTIISTAKIGASNSDDMRIR